MLCPAEPQILLAAARHVSAMFSWLTSAALLHLGNIQVEHGVA